MLPRELSDSLRVARIFGALTLVRSVAYDRWITVLGAALILVGATAALRHRTWGVGLALAASTAFPVAWAIGIAPAWFCLVGVAGAMPFVHAWPAFARFDKRAATLFGGLAALGGTAIALLWKKYALAVFAALPALAPSVEPNHVLSLLGVASAGAAVAVALGLRVGGCGDAVPRATVLSGHARIAPKETRTEEAMQPSRANDAADDTDADDPEAETEHEHEGRGAMAERQSGR